jgi:regulator of replication initiation timing
MLQRRSSTFGIGTLVFFLLRVGLLAAAQTATPDQGSVADPSLAEAVRQLQQQVRELRSVVADLRSESERYHAETRELREELHAVMAERTQTPATGHAEQATQLTTPAGPDSSVEAATRAQKADARLAKLEEQYDLLTGKVDDQYQTKVESRSKYKIRLSGLVLLNLFSTRGYLLNADLPGIVDAPDPLGRSNSTGFALRQSQIGLEVFGPEIAGARTHGDLQADFAGGFPNASNGAALGLFRLRTATVHFDWARTSIVAGQDAPFFSALSPTSFATVAEPALSYAGNLWTWIPQIRVERRLTLSENSNITVQGGILDGFDGERPPYSYGRTAQSGEYSRQPGYAGRIAWSHRVFGQPMTLGAGGYYSRQNWGFGRNVNAWAGTADWNAPITRWLSLSGEFYRGQALGGLGGGAYQSALFTANPTDPNSRVRGLDVVGGWSQLKFRASPKVEFNLAAGQDNPFASQLRAYPIAGYGTINVGIARNQSELVNVIYRPRSDLVLAAEYRHVGTHDADNTPYSADHVNLSLGILF